MPANKATIVVFRLPPHQTNAELGKFVKKFYGQDSNSGKGRYAYHRKGFLEEIPHRKLLRGVVILRQKDLEKVLAFLKEWQAQVEVREIKPTPEDSAKLGD